jgi:predicted CoA-binding protein
MDAGGLSRGKKTAAAVIALFHNKPIRGIVLEKSRERVVVLGASNKPGRYSYRALKELVNHGHEAVPVHPVLKEIEGIKVVNRLADIKGRVDTVTLYVGPERSAGMAAAIAALKPRRIIANPGAESEEIKKEAEKKNIEYVEACTLVMLASGQF